MPNLNACTLLLRDPIQRELLLNPERNMLNSLTYQGNNL